MKVVYILGLEHSGTTLLSQLIGSVRNTLALGEVEQYFSDSHMEFYHDKWGHYPDAYRCSCGENLSSCKFWGEFQRDKYANQDERYTALSNYIKATFKKSLVVVDSSKSLNGLDKWQGQVDSGAITCREIKVVLAVKDVRGFVASMKRKSAKKGFGLKDVYHAFNYWFGVNLKLKRALSQFDFETQVCLYEHVCKDSLGVTRKILRDISSEVFSEVRVDHRNSHIAIGNKSFLERNRGEIKYDAAWRQDWRINFMYALHLPARILNRTFCKNSKRA